MGGITGFNLCVFFLRSLGCLGLGGKGGVVAQMSKKINEKWRKENRLEFRNYV